MSTPNDTRPTRLFAVRIDGYEGFSTVEATSASKARYIAWLRINDVLPVRLIDLKVKRLVPDPGGCAAPPPTTTTTP